MLRPSTLQSAFDKLGYTWFDDQPNLIGIRSTLNIPNVFNDIFSIVWKQPSMPKMMSIKAKQAWLNSWGYQGKDGKALKEDGIAGDNTSYAEDTYEKMKGFFVMRSSSITTDPGTYYLNHPLNSLGTAVLKPGQYFKSHALGFHKQQQDHPALVQVGNLTVYRDTDLDEIAETTGMKEYTANNFGINIHRSNLNGTTPNINKWSAGCQVFQKYEDHAFILRICENYRAQTNNRFTYTLIDEASLAIDQEICPTCKRPL